MPYNSTKRVMGIHNEENNMSTKSRVAIVTGAAGGLGGAVAHLLAESGHDQILIDNRTDALEEMSGALPQKGGRSVPLAVDLANVEECERVIAETVKNFGKVDILVNAAAILDRRDMNSVTPEYFDHIFHVNARAVFYLSRAAIPEMAKHNWGRIVNCTSIGVYQGGNTMTSIVYESTKGAVSVFTKMFANYGADKGILVNTVCPGGMKSRLNTTAFTNPDVLRMTLDQVPLNRLCEPIEVGRMVAWLVSEENTYATGATFDIIGGRVMN